MTERLLNALEVCLNALDSGASVAACLQLFPDLADDLRPTLEAALSARSLAVEHVPTEAQKRSQARMLTRAVQLRTQTGPRISWLRIPKMAFTALIIVFVFLLTSSGLLVASAETLPGDTLYPVKRVVEDIRIRLAPGIEQKQTIEENYYQQRIDEVLRLIQLGRIQSITYDGVVIKISSNNWNVGGVQVVVSPQTTLIGPIEIGMLVEVEGKTVPEGWVEAHEIHLREYEIRGQVETIGRREWVISGAQVQISPISQYDQSIQPGDAVIALVRSTDDGLLYALAILRLGHDSPMEDLPPTVVPSPNPTLDPSSEADTQRGATPEINQGEIEFTGKVETITVGYWVIDGIRVYISAQVEIDAHIAIGNSVKVKGWVDQDGTLYAIRIERSEPEGSANTQEATQEASDHGGGDDDILVTPTPEADDGSHEATPTPEESQPTNTPEDNDQDDPSSTPEEHSDEDGTETPTPEAPDTTPTPDD